MDELEFYQGAYSGQEIDAAIAQVQNAQSAEISHEDYNNASLVRVQSVVKALRAEIIKATKTGITGTGGVVSGGYQIDPPIPTPASWVSISEKHVVLWYEFSNPTAVMGDWTITTAANGIFYSGALNGTTDLTLYLGLVDVDKPF